MNCFYENEDSINQLFFIETFDKLYENELHEQHETLLTEDNYVFKDFFSQNLSNTSTEMLSNLDSTDNECFYLQKKLGRTPRTPKQPIIKDNEQILLNINNKSQTHTKYFFDNILRKIKVLFHQFLIHFLNECIKIEFPKIKNFSIKKIDGKKTQDITLSHNKILLNLTLKETLIQFTSKKYKNLKPQENESNIRFIMQSNSYLKDLLNMKYSECYMELFVKGNENVVDKKFRHVLNESITLHKFVNNSLNGDHYYLNKVYDVAINKFVQHFQNTKIRKPKQKKINSL